MCVVSASKEQGGRDTDPDLANMVQDAMKGFDWPSSTTASSFAVSFCIDDDPAVFAQSAQEEETHEVAGAPWVS